MLLVNPKLSAAEILAYRDYAWQTYFSAPSYLSLAEKEFGPAVVDHISRMRAMPLARASSAAIPAHAKISMLPVSSVA
jgi:anaerobic magnesium-protoporphyrin IX monomethyl ester cyclase